MNRPPPRLRLGSAVGLVWLVAVVAVPLLSLAAAPLGTLLGLEGPCYEFQPIWSAVLAVNLGVPAGIVLTLVFLSAWAMGVKGGTWTRFVLGLYAIAGVALSVYFSGMCK